jgi:acetyltransferase-like isoleucine patch superfamily enzyme/acyl carrier protein
MKLLEQLWTKFQRDKQLPFYVRRRKAVRYLESLALSGLYLRHVDQVGKRARTRGNPFIENLGKMTIGDDFNFVSIWVQSHLVTGHAGTLTIGNSVNINFGAAISAHESVVIQDRVRIGPYVIIMDSDYHSAQDRALRPTAPIVIEEDVWLAGRVSVLKGSRIGRGSVITAGSVVSGDIPPGVIAGGVPARVLRRIDGGDRAHLVWTEERASTNGAKPAGPAEPAKPAKSAQPAEPGTPAEPAEPASVDHDLLANVTSVIKDTFALDGTVELSWGPKQIPKWDSMGQLSLTVALEEKFAITISEHQLVEMVDVARVCSIVRDCLEEAH